jgi:hypothetical protein
MKTSSKWIALGLFALVSTPAWCELGPGAEGPGAGGIVNGGVTPVGPFSTYARALGNQAGEPIPTPSSGPVTCTGNVPAICTGVPSTAGQAALNNPLPMPLPGPVVPPAGPKGPVTCTGNVPAVCTGVPTSH